MPTKISNFPTSSNPALNDLIPIIDVSETNTSNQNKKVTVETLLNLNLDLNAGNPYLQTNLTGSLSSKIGESGIILGENNDIVNVDVNNSLILGNNNEISVSGGFQSSDHNYIIGSFNSTKESNKQTVILGYLNILDADSDYSIVIGSENFLGYRSDGYTFTVKDSKKSVIAGFNNTSLGFNNLILGSENTCFEGTQNGILLGSSSTLNIDVGIGNTGNTLNAPIAIGYQAVTKQDYAIAIGASTSVNSLYSSVIGYNTSIELGSSNSIAIGNNCNIEEDSANNVILGSNSTINTGITNSVLLGTGTITNSNNLQFNNTSIADANLGIKAKLNASAPIVDNTKAGVIAINNSIPQYVNNSGIWTNISSATLLTTTKGDIIAHNGTTDVRFPVGNDGEALIANSTTGTGLSWQPITPTTTEGDLIVRKATSDQRLPIGSDGEVLTVDLTLNGKLKWAAPAGGTASPLTTLGDIYVRNNSSNARLPIGTNGQILSVDTAAGSSLSWVPASPLTTIGDIYVRNNDGNTRLPIGTNGQVLTVDTSVSTLGLKWTTPSVGDPSPLTTIGDIYVRNNSGNTRLPLGIDGQVLTVDTSVSTLGLKWATPSGGGSSPLTTKGDIQIFASAVTRLPVGSNGQVLTADSSVASGVKWSGSPVPGINNKALYVLDGAGVGSISTSGTSISFAASETITGTLGLNFTTSVGNFISSSLDANRWIVSGCISFQSANTNCRIVVYPSFTAGAPAKSAVDLVPWGSGMTGTANVPIPIHIHGVIDNNTATSPYNFSIFAKGSSICTMSAENAGTNIFSRISIFRAS